MKTAMFIKPISSGRASQILGDSQDTVVRMCEDGTLRAARDPRNGYWRIDYESVMELKERRRNSE